MNINHYIARHRIAFPDASFVGVDGEVHSSTGDQRMWDMYWRIIQARNRPPLELCSTLFGDCEWLNFKTSRRLAREAIRCLRSGWYIR